MKVPNSGCPKYLNWKGCSGWSRSLLTLKRNGGWGAPAGLLISDQTKEVQNLMHVVMNNSQTVYSYLDWSTFHGHGILLDLTRHHHTDLSDGGTLDCGQWECYALKKKYPSDGWVALQQMNPLHYLGADILDLEEYCPAYSCRWLNNNSSFSWHHLRKVADYLP